MEYQRLEAGVGNGSAAIAADERVGRTGGKTKNKSDQVPGNGAEEASEEDLLIDHLDVNHAFTNGGGDRGAEDEGGDKIPESGPGDGSQRREDARGDDRGDGIGSVMPAIGKLKGQR